MIYPVGAYIYKVNVVSPAEFLISFIAGISRSYLDSMLFQEIDIFLNSVRFNVAEGNDLGPWNGQISVQCIRAASAKAYETDPDSVNRGEAKSEDIGLSLRTGRNFCFMTLDCPLQHETASIAAAATTVNNDINGLE